MEKMHGFTIMAMPRSGLFRYGVGDKFVDGKGNDIPWGHRMAFYMSHGQAQTAARRLQAQYQRFDGDFIILRVDLDPIDERFPE